MTILIPWHADGKRNQEVACTYVVARQDFVSKLKITWTSFKKREMSWTFAWHHNCQFMDTIVNKTNIFTELFRHDLLILNTKYAWPRRGREGGRERGGWMRVFRMPHYKHIKIIAELVNVLQRKIIWVWIQAMLCPMLVSSFSLKDNERMNEQCLLRMMLKMALAGALSFVSRELDDDATLQVLLLMLILL